MQKIIFLFSMFFSSSLLAQFGPMNPLSSRSNGIANASVSFNDINSLFNNQAGLAELKNTSLLLSGQETFKNPNSDNLGGGLAVPVSSGTIAFNYHYFESTEVKQSKIGLAYARKLMNTLSIGVQFDMLVSQIPLNEKSNLFTFEIGLQYQLIENLLLGIHLYNPTKQELIQNDFLPTILRVGATYSPYRKLLVHAELEKDFDFPYVFKSGIEYELVNDFWFRLGFQNKPTTFNFGMGYLFKKKIRFDVAIYYQQGLNLISSGRGNTEFVPTFGLGYNFIK